jgi:hypothetical protein
MELKDLFRPKWKHSESKVRLAAVKQLTNQTLLIDIARNDPDDEVRKAAIEHLEDQAVLAEIARSNPAPTYSALQCCTTAATRLVDLSTIGDIAKTHPDARVREHARMAGCLRLDASDKEAWLADVVKARLAAVEQTSDQTELLKIAQNESLTVVRSAALMRLTDENLLAHFATCCVNDTALGKAAVERIANQQLLAEIAIGGWDLAVQLAAVDRVTEPGLLADILKRAGLVSVAEAARKRLPKDEDATARERFQQVFRRCAYEATEEMMSGNNGLNTDQMRDPVLARKITTIALNRASEIVKREHNLTDAQVARLLETAR